MKYIVQNEDVSRDVYYFCLKMKNENKSFILLNETCKINKYVNNNPWFDYYIVPKYESIYYKSNENVKQWFKKMCSWQEEPFSEITRRYERSKLKDTLTFEEWCMKNGWELKTETDYDIERIDVPKADDGIEDKPTRKFVSVVVNNNKTVEALNSVSNVQYVLRNEHTTEIIYFDDVMDLGQ